MTADELMAQLRSYHETVEASLWCKQLIAASADMIEKLLADGIALGDMATDATQQRDKLWSRLKHIEDLVALQASDEGLWFQEQTASEAYLQQELRRLHAAIEGKSSEDCAMAALQGQSMIPITFISLALPGQKD